MTQNWENDSCETLQACYAVYTVPVVAALWCGVPADQTTEELRKASPIGQSNALGRAILRHPYMKCLEPRIRAIHAAIDAGELPTCREDGRRVEDHVAYQRRHVYGLDLKEWAKKIAPTERPAFLFDDVERDVHPAISAEAYRVLKATHDAKEHKLSEAIERIRHLEEAKGHIEAERNSLRDMVDKYSAQLQTANFEEKRLTPKERNTDAKVLDALLKKVGINPSDRGAASRIVELTTENGRPITHPTASTLLARIREAADSE